MEIGLLLPHFGPSATADRLVKTAVRAEAAGVDGLWVRDHVMFHPHSALESPDRTCLEALTVLTAVGAATRHVTLGTAALVPFRHPLYAALTLGTMERFFEGRLVLGVGSGVSDAEFAALGLADVDRVAQLPEYVEAMRHLWRGDGGEFVGEHVDLGDAAIEVGPLPDGIPIWYCGSTPAAVRRAVAFADGWLPGRLGIDTLRKRLRSLATHSEEAGREPLRVGFTVLTCLADTRDEAASLVDVASLTGWANRQRYWVEPPGGRFESIDDLEGVLVYGGAKDVVEQCMALWDTGIEHLVLDLRLTLDRWDDQLDRLTDEVVPALRHAASRD